MKTLLVFYTFTLISLNLLSQEMISGCVLAENGKPIPYASISINETIGTITNTDGFFNLELPQNKLDTLLVRCLGYKSKSCTIDEIKERKTVLLSPVSYQLDNITISPIDPENIVKEATKKIKTNYNRNIKLYGVYGQTFLSNGKYQGIFKADINVNIKGFNKNRPSKIETEVLKHELYLSDTSRHFISENALLKTMCVSYKHFILLKNSYTFTYEGRFFSNNKEIIKISFKPKEVDTGKTQVKGYMFIDNVTKSYLYFDYSLVSKEDNFLINNDIKQRRTGYNAKISYVEQEHYYSVNYAIITHEMDIMFDDGTIAKNHSIFNFFSKNSQEKQSTPDSTYQSISDILKNSKGKTLSKSNDKIKSYVIESDDALEFKRSIE
ncbi:carboxypeptidase-like regulatory domain-containing protein [Marinifilum sp. RC60d5]|uniref:carboxypeptidase-like regulatory domain-containing protein n=1 Tax=Marinifilum sp. RC60d5 TaxID=3458414 RepID=UPI0040350519